MPVYISGSLWFLGLLEHSLLSPIQVLPQFGAVYYTVYSKETFHTNDKKCSCHNISRPRDTFITEICKTFNWVKLLNTAETGRRFHTCPWLTRASMGVGTFLHVKIGCITNMGCVGWVAWAVWIELLSVALIPQYQSRELENISRPRDQENQYSLIHCEAGLL